MLELFERSVKSLFLRGGVSGEAKDASHGVAHRMDGARRPHGFRLLRLNRDEHGWNSFCFNLSLHRNDHPMAERSTAGENNSIGLRSLDLVRDGRGEMFVLALEIR